MRIQEALAHGLIFNDEDLEFISSLSIRVHKYGYLVTRINHHAGISIHKLIAERSLNRPLQSGERIKYKDGNYWNLSRSNIDIPKLAKEITNEVFIIDKLKALKQPKKNKKRKPHFCSICKLIEAEKHKLYCIECRQIRKQQIKKIQRLNYKFRYPEKHKEKKKKQKKRRQERNPENFKLKNRIQRIKYRKRNPNKIKAARHRYQARLRNAEGSFTAQEWEQVKLNQQNKCKFCNVSGEINPLTVDHIIPLSKGGSNYISNIQGLCMLCNSTKRDLIITENFSLVKI